MSILELLRRLYVAGANVSLSSEGGIRVRGNPPPPDPNNVMNDAIRTAADKVKG